MRKAAAAILCLMIILVLVAAACQKPVVQPKDDGLDELGAKDAELPETYVCPLDGAIVSDASLIERRPLSVVIGNIPGLAEVSGVDKACLVYEVLAEGGITRLVPVFLHQEAPLLGSVRSARHYLLDLALEYGAAFGHCGYSPQAKQDIAALKVVALNEFFLPQVYWRQPGKPGPHNVYTSTERLFLELERRGLLQSPSAVKFDFYEQWERPMGAGAGLVTLRFSPNYVVQYEWNECAGGYTRLVNGKPQVDEASGQILMATNIMVQSVKGTRVLDQEGRLDMQLVGQGTGRMFHQGVSYELRWSKSGRSSPTEWTDNTGVPIRLMKGQTWIEILPEETPIVWK